MPLKFLKRCRQYNVTSKSLFVISVHHLLDTSTTVDCTISSESKGQECLDNVCQRLLIQQPEFFGLRYVVKGKEDELKWIDLDRSLSRQLEKYAAGTKIYLRVRHYVTTGVRHLSDEVTRYYYYLQLKSDIYESKIVCDIRTAILLALYCRQAEYDSYQGDKQSKDYLKKSMVLPLNLQALLNDDNLRESLTLEVQQQHAGIQHLSQMQAEEMYIQCCQQLDGYGEERFQAKDTLGNDLLLGLAINGMVVTAENGRQYFPWKDFHTVTIDKRTIKIEQNKADGSIVGSFNFSEAEMARYFWKLCITQHKFFKRYIDEDSPSLGDVESANGISIAGSGAEAFAYDFNDSREDLLLEQQQRATYTPSAGSLSNHTNTEFVSAQSLHQQHQQMQPGLMASTKNSNALMSSNISLANSHQSGGGSAGNSVMRAHSGGALGQNWLNKNYSHGYVSSQQQLSNSILDTRLQSTSCLDLSNNNINNLHSSITGSNQMLASDAHERERLKAMLPVYRPAPDYQTAIQLKYSSPSSEMHNINNLAYQSAAPPTLMSHYYAGSQPDVHNAAAIYGDGVLLSHMATHRYPDVAQPAAALHINHHINAPTAVPPLQHMAIGGGGVTNNVYIDLAQRMHMMRSKPPPPYPVNRLSSSSTPDLAVASHRPLQGYRAYVSGSSPDLVSNRNLLNSQYPYGAATVVGANTSVSSASSNAAAILHPSYPSYGHMCHSQPYLQHGTFENLNMIEEQPSIMSQLRQSALSQAAATQSYEQTPPQLPPTGYRAVPVQQQQQPPQPATLVVTPAPAPLQRNAINGSIEPIYENVPLPQAEQRSSGSSTHASEAIRNRTASIQSAPGGIHAQLPLTVPVPAARNPQQIRPHEPDEISMNIKKFGTQTHANSELQFIEPTPPQRSTRAGSAAPTICVTQPPATTMTKQTPPPRHQKANLIKTSSSISALDMNSPITNKAATTARHASHDELQLQQTFGTLNLSASSSSQYNTTLETTSSTNTSTATKEVKRKKRWNILGRSKTPDKQKSATLGREKASPSSSASTSTSSKMSKGKLTAQDDLNLPHRWSTGVPKLLPISGQYSKDKLCQILNEKLTDPQLFMEFEAIPKRRENARYDCALMEENAAKNADPHFLPYDDNRVRITPTMENRHGYVNASHISSTVGTKQRFYIVAQSPHDTLTTRIFWQCVWEADVYLIVQLSDELNYIPPNSNQRLEFGQFQVYQEFSQTTDRCVTSKLRLYHIQSRRYRSVWHLSYTDWAEQNCPRDVNHFLDFLEELNSVRMASINEVPPGHNTNPPVLLHCLEGGGRSGVTLTSDLLLYTLDHNEDLFIPRVIGQLRHQRDSIIPSLAQYKFIYSLLISYLKRTRLI